MNEIRDMKASLIYGRLVYVNHLGEPREDHVQMSMVAVGGVEDALDNVACRSAA